MVERQIRSFVQARRGGGVHNAVVYGLALDQGLLHPQSVLRDAPTEPTTPWFVDWLLRLDLWTYQTVGKYSQIPAFRDCEATRSGDISVHTAEYITKSSTGQSF